MRTSNGSTKGQATAEEQQHYDTQDGVMPFVAEKYLGTEGDKIQMKMLGRTQETRRVFTFVTILGFGSTLIVTWEVLLTNIGLILVNGGTAGMFWGFIFVLIGWTLVYLSLSEMSSMAPTSGGQYHWVSELAPSGVQRYLSYIVGWLTFTGWQSAITAIGSLVAGAIQGLIALHNPDYGWERWHTTLMTIAVVFFCVLINIYVAKRLPLVESFLAFIHFGGLFIVIVVLWTLSPRNNAHDAFLEFSNNGGYASDGVSFMVGLLPLTLCLLGFDSQVHMSEEVQHSAKSIPRSIMFSTYINAFLGFIMAVTLIFTWGDMAEIADSAYGWPFLSIFYNATGSAAATTAMTMLIILPLTGSVIACVATASRQTWAFARDGGVPFSATVRHIKPKSAIPLNAIIISLFLCVLLSLINIGSTAALNAILALDLTALLASYILSIGCLVLKRVRGQRLPHREWSLGRAGLPINIAALCWLFPVLVFTLFPSEVPVTPEGMNWGCLLFGFMVLFASGYYILGGRRYYISPRERLRRSQEDEILAASS